MAGKAQTKRKDKDRIVLRKGESQRKNGTYHFSWTDKTGKRHFIYAPTLEELRDYFPRHYTAAQMMQEIKVALKERQQRLARQRNRDAR